VADLKDAGPMDVVFLCVSSMPAAAGGTAGAGAGSRGHSGRQHLRMEFRGGIFSPMTAQWRERAWKSLTRRGAWFLSRLKARRGESVRSVYFSTEIIEPGVVKHNEGTRMSLGEPDGSRSERIRKIAEALIASGLRAPVTTHLRTKSG